MNAELEALIAEQEKDAQWGDRVFGVSLNQQAGDDDGGGAASLGDFIVTSDHRYAESATRRVAHPQKWTREEIIACIRAWAREHGEPPRGNEWKKTNGRGVPGPTTVARRFGSWSAAIEAAGFTPRPVGGTSQRAEVADTRLRRRVRKAKRTAYLTPERIAAAYVIYDRQGLSTTDLATLLWRDYGYRSMYSCRTALIRAFHAEGFRLRTKQEAWAAKPAAWHAEMSKVRSANTTRQHARRRAGAPTEAPGRAA